MPIPFKSSPQFNEHPLLKIVIEKLASAPSSPAEGRIYYNTGSKTYLFWDGTEWIDIGGDIRNIVGTAPIQVSITDGEATISIDPATQSDPGSMSAADKTKLDGSTSAPTTSTLMERDGSGRAQVEDPSANKDIANKQYVDRSVIQGRTWKELVLHPNQLHSSGVVQAIPFWLTGNPANDDTLVLTDGSTTETYQYKTSASGAFQIQIGASANDTMDNIVTQINTDSSIWNAAKATDLQSLHASGNVVVIYRQTASEAATDRIYGSLTTQSNGNYVNYNGLYDYSSETTAQLPAADPNQEEFGFAREIANVKANSTHNTFSEDKTYTWDTDADVWQQSDASTITASNGLVKVGNDIQGIDATTTAKGVQENATQTEAEARASNSRTITPDTLSNYSLRKGFDVTGDDTTTDFALTHNFGHRDIEAVVWEAQSPYAKVEVTIEANSVNQVTVKFAVAPATGENYRVIVAG